jgi:hypothetical protein
LIEQFRVVCLICIYNFRMAHGISDEDSTKKEHVDSPDVLDKKLDQLANLIRSAKHFIVFTG